MALADDVGLGHTFDDLYGDRRAATGSDPIAGFVEAIAAAGLSLPERLVADGQLHRFASDANRRGDNSGWYVLHADEPVSGAFGCYRSDIKQTWTAGANGRAMTEAERLELQRRIDADRAAREAEQAEIRAACRRESEDTWKKLPPAEPDHAYLDHKRIKPHGARRFGDRIIIPVRDIDGGLHGLQRITSTGAKIFTFGTAVAGHFYMLGDPGDVIIIAEGFATSASLREATDHTVVVAFNAGNLLPVAEVIRERYPTARIAIAGDHDDSGVGQEKALAAAAAVGGVVAIPDVTGDWNDWHVTYGLDAVREAIDAALDAEPEPATADAPDGPMPLYPPLAPADDYPLDALGDVLGAAAYAIASKVQVPGAIAAQSVLAVAALAAQAHADVVLPFGQSRPLSLYFITVAGSGDRKTSADSEARWPVDRHEANLRNRRDAEAADYRVKLKAHAAAEKRIIGGKDNDIEAQLRDLGPEPLPPLEPTLTADAPTVEGLAKMMPVAWPALGIFSAEGGQLIGGHGMSDENRLKTAAALSELWDGRPIKRIRAGDGVTILPGRRLSIHLLVQPEAAAGFLSNPTLRDQGLLSRMLVAAPDSMAGSRRYRDTDPADDAAIKRYGARILAILDAPWSLAEGKRNELAPRRLPMSAAAAHLWRAFHDHIEDRLGRGGELHPIRDFAAKAAEHAARLAGVLTVVADLAAHDIGESEMRQAIVLADWYVAEALRLAEAARTDPRLLRAQELLEWLAKRDDDCVRFRDIIRCGPRPFTRTKDGADEAVSILIKHGWLVELSAKPRILKLEARP